MAKKHKSDLEYPLSAYGSTVYSFPIAAQIAGNKVNKQLIRQRVKQGRSYTDMPTDLRALVAYLCVSFKLHDVPTGVAAIKTDINQLLFVPFVDNHILSVCHIPLYPFHHKPVKLWDLKGNEIFDYYFTDNKGVVHEVKQNKDITSEVIQG